MSLLNFYLYRSLATVPQHSIDDVDILRVALRNNTTFGVTGFMYKSRTHFFQYFEGAQPIVDQLFQNITKDRRHAHVQVLMSGEAPYRRFEGWSMGYSDYTDADARNHIDLDDSPSSILQKLQQGFERQTAKLLKPPTLAHRERHYREG